MRKGAIITVDCSGANPVDSAWVKNVTSRPSTKRLIDAFGPALTLICQRDHRSGAVSGRARHHRCALPGAHSPVATPTDLRFAPALVTSLLALRAFGQSVWEQVSRPRHMWWTNSDLWSRYCSF